jgi:hypothetical protein
MARFQREAQVLASLNHPNIATIHGLEDSIEVPPVNRAVSQIEQVYNLASRQQLLKENPSWRTY